MIILPNSFQVIQDYPTRQQFERCRRENRPMLYISKRINQYSYLTMDFTTCDWTFSPKGLENVQYHMNWELFKLWKKTDFNLKDNYTSIPKEFGTLRLTDNLITSFIDFLNVQCMNELYWITKPTDFEEHEALKEEYEKHSLSGLIHWKNNTNKVYVMNDYFRKKQENRMKQNKKANDEYESKYGVAIDDIHNVQIDEPKKWEAVAVEEDFIKPIYE